MKALLYKLGLLLEVLITSYSQKGKDVIVSKYVMYEEIYTVNVYSKKLLWLALTLQLGWKAPFMNRSAGRWFIERRKEFGYIHIIKQLTKNVRFSLELYDKDKDQVTHYSPYYGAY